MPRTVFAKSRTKGRRKYNAKDPRGVTKIIRSRWYPFQITRVKRGVNNPTKLRKGLEPGKILILLTGPYRGRRVVFLKQLPHSGLLLVTGPFSVNGVPLRRVSQRFVIITSTKIDITGVDAVKTIEDSYFKKTKVAKKGNEKEKSGRAQFPEEKRNVQKAVDTQLMSIISKVNLMQPYLTSYFTLKAGQPPHSIKF